MTAEQVGLTIALLSPLAIAVFFFGVSLACVGFQLLSWYAYHYYLCFKRTRCGASAIVPKTEKEP